MNVLGRQDPEDALHAKGFACVYAPDPGVGHGAQEHLREDHALCLEVLGEPGATRDLGDQVRRGDVPSNRLLGHRSAPHQAVVRLSSAARIAQFRILL